MKISVFLILAAFGIAAGKDVPSVFQKCKKTDDNLKKCLTETANKGWPELVKGDASWGTISLEPFHEEIVNILQAQVTNASLTGLEGVHFNEIKFDFKKNAFNAIFTCPRISITGSIDVEGNILSLQLADKGTFNSTLYGGVYDFWFKYELKEKDGQQFIDIKQSAVHYNIDNLNAELNGGDQRRNARTNKFFKDNWKIINAVSTQTFNKILSVGFTSHVEKLLKDVPFNDLFE